MSDMPDEIWTLFDSPHTGTFCDVNDGGVKYTPADLNNGVRERVKTAEDIQFYKNEIDKALKYVRNAMTGIESNISNLDITIIDDETKVKALNKIDKKMDIFETLEAVCEQCLALLAGDEHG